MIVTSVQIKTAKTQKHLYCPVFTNKKACEHRIDRHSRAFLLSFLHHKLRVNHRKKSLLIAKMQVKNF